MSCAFMAINMVIAAFVIGNVTILMTRADVALLAYRDDAQVIILSRAVSCGTPECCDVSCRVVSCRVVSCRVVLWCVVLCCVVSCAGTRALASFASCHSLGRLVLCCCAVSCAGTRGLASFASCHSSRLVSARSNRNRRIAPLDDDAVLCHAALLA